MGIEKNRLIVATSRAFEVFFRRIFRDFKRLFKMIKSFFRNWLTIGIFAFGRWNKKKYFHRPSIFKNEIFSKNFWKKPSTRILKILFCVIVEFIIEMLRYRLFYFLFLSFELQMNTFLFSCESIGTKIDSPLATFYIVLRI